MYIKNTDIAKSVLLVAVPYLLLGAIFGKLFRESGGEVLGASLMATFTFAGTSQFVALRNLDLNVFALFIIIFVINIRHVAYILDCKKEIGSSGFASMYLCLSMTDENYSLLKIYKQRKIIPTKKQLCAMFFSTHCFWVSGCCFGSFAFVNLSLKGGEFILTSLFVIIVTNSILEFKWK